MNPTSNWLNIQQAADHLKVAKSTMYKKVMDKTVPFYKFGGRVLFKPEELDKMVERCNAPIHRGVTIEDR